MDQVPFCDVSGRVVGTAAVTYGQSSVGFRLLPIRGAEATLTLMRGQFANPFSSPGASGGQVTVVKEGVRLTSVGGPPYTIPLDRYNGLLSSQDERPLSVVGALIHPDAVAERLKKGAYWAVSLTPAEPRSKGLSDKELTMLMVSVATNLTGHPYPSPNTKDGHYLTSLGTMTSWTEDEDRESWRFDDDGRFQHLLSLPEDTPEYQEALRGTYRGTATAPENYLSVTQGIWVPTRILKFIANLAGRDFYEDGVEVEVEIRGVSGRGAGFGKGGRYLRGPSLATADATRLTKDSVLADHRGIARTIAGSLLDQLGIDLSPKGIESVQAELKDKVE